MSNLNINKQGGRTIYEEGKNRNKDCNMKKHKIFWDPSCLIYLEHKVPDLATQM